MVLRVLLLPQRLGPRRHRPASVPRTHVCHPRPRLLLVMSACPAAPTLAALDDFLTLVGRVYYREPETGVSSADGSGFIVLRRTVLGRLTSPLRRPTVLDKWSPYQAALFESAICLVGKDFNAIADLVEGKTEQDVMEFYYAWKKSKNYARWKATFRPPARV